MKPGREFDSRLGHENFLCPRASMVSPSSKLKTFTGSVCVLLTSVSLKLIKIEINLFTQLRVREKKKKMAGER